MPGLEGQGDTSDTPKAGEAKRVGTGPQQPLNRQHQLCNHTLPDPADTHTHTHTHLTSSSLHPHWTRDTLIYLSMICFVTVTSQRKPEVPASPRGEALFRC